MSFKRLFLFPMSNSLSSISSSLRRFRFLSNMLSHFSMLFASFVIVSENSDSDKQVDLLVSISACVMKSWTSLLIAFAVLQVYPNAYLS